MNLLIVESPNKIKKIKDLLGSDWEVGASAGHIRDIPGKDLGINRAAGTYGITYGIDPKKEELVDRLKKMVAQVGAANVWVATDPDREGEAIGYHLCKVLGLDTKTTKRITFMEITGPAIQAAIKAPRLLDMPLVAAQEARRALDRLVGWEVSPTLGRSQPKPKAGEPNFSAGRVQSVATRMVVEMEEAIEQFAAGSGVSFPISARFATKASEAGPGGEVVPGRLLAAPGTPAPADPEAFARQLLSQLSGTGSWRVRSVEQKPLLQTPSPAYSTSTLQQDGVRKLKLSVAKISELAQQLFEEGHITYIRTDSVNVGEEGQAQALAQISAQYGPEFAEARRFKEKAGVQGGHEAIRPTHWEVKQAGSSPDARRLYSLIYERTLASQMSAARYAQTVITIGSEEPGIEALFESRVKVLEFAGYRAAYQEAEEEKADDGGEADEAEQGALSAPLSVGQALELARLQARGSMQKPPKRYNEADLVAHLEKMQIGRPSTYASTIATIFKRQYVAVGDVAGKKVATKTLSWESGQPAGTLSEVARQETLGGDKAKLLPTERGRSATAWLKQYFGQLVDYGFTASCEEKLDAIAEGQLQYRAMLSEFDEQLLSQKEVALKDAPVPEPRSRIVGEWQGQPVRVGATKYGDSVSYGSQGAAAFYNMPEGLSWKDITLEKAVELIEDGQRTQKRLVGEYEKKPIMGGISRKTDKPYLIWKEQFFDLPEGIGLDFLTPEKARLTVATQLEEAQLAKVAGLINQIDKNWLVWREKDRLWLGNSRDKIRLAPFITEQEAANWDKAAAEKQWANDKKYRAKQKAQAK